MLTASPSTRIRNIFLLYWVVYYILISLIEAGPQQYYREAFSSNLITLPIKVAFVMIVVGPLMDIFLLRKRITIFLVSYFGLLIMFAIILRYADNYLVLSFILTHWTKQPILDGPAFLYNMIKLQFVAAIPFMIKLFSFWAETEKRNSEQLRHQKEAELEFLRNQFNPHFLFNSLNTLYSKILTNPAEASEVVLKIGSLLRFSLYEASHRSITLSKEIEYLTDYMELQKLRFSDSISISFSTFGKIDKGFVEPFLILPFVENSFKHCQPDNDGQAWITVQISVEENYVIAQIDNSMNGGTTLSENETGIGHQNVQKRLDILYPQQYTLRCERGDENYYVYLKFPLTIDGN